MHVASVGRGGVEASDRAFSTCVQACVVRDIQVCNLSVPRIDEEMLRVLSTDSPLRGRYWITADCLWIAPVTSII